MVKKTILASTLVGILVFFLIGCGNSSTTQKASSQSSDTASTTSSSQASSATSTIFGIPKVVNVMNGSNTKSLGTSSIFYVSETDCTLENLVKWHEQYVKNSDDLYCVIVFDEDENRGIIDSSGVLRVDVLLEKDQSGSYSTSDTENTKSYYISDSGKISEMHDN